MHSSIKSFRAGSCRNNDRALSHTYAETDEGLYPMCGYGWNRSDGERYSIWRSPEFTEGDCKICSKNLHSGKPPVVGGFKHKNKWI